MCVCVRAARAGVRPGAGVCVGVRGCLYREGGIAPILPLIDKYLPVVDTSLPTDDLFLELSNVRPMFVLPNGVRAKRWRTALNRIITPK